MNEDLYNSRRTPIYERNSAHYSERVYTTNEPTENKEETKGMPPYSKLRHQKGSTRNPPNYDSLPTFHGRKLSADKVGFKSLQEAETRGPPLHLGVVHLPPPRVVVGPTRWWRSGPIGGGGVDQYGGNGVDPWR